MAITAQNALIGQNNQSRVLLELEKSHRGNCERMQRMQDRVGVVSRLRHTCKQQEQVCPGLALFMTFYVCCAMY